MKGIRIFPNKKQKYARDRCQNLSEKEKDKKCQYHCQPHKNLSENKKQRIAKHGRNCYLTHKK